VRVGAGVYGDFNIYIRAFADPASGSESETTRIGDVFNTACFIGGIRVKPRAVAWLFSLVYKNTVQKWDSPYDNVPVTDSDRDRILNNIREAFRFHGFGIDVI
jgi:hypothetical protein